MKNSLFLLSTLASASLAPAGIQTETLMVPMRDGSQLATDVHRDDAAGGDLELDAMKPEKSSAKSRQTQNPL